MEAIIKAWVVFLFVSFAITVLTLSYVQIRGAGRYGWRGPLMALRKRFLIRASFAVFVSWLALSSAGQAFAGDQSPELRRQIIDAGLAPWNGRQVSLDETLRGPNREKVSLRQLVGKPILAYNYAQW